MNPKELPLEVRQWATGKVRTPYTLREKCALVAEILGAYVRIRWSLWRHGFNDTVAASRSRSGVPLDAEGMAEQIEGIRLGRAVTRTLRALPTDSKCLIRSLVLGELLSRRGVKSVLVIGVRSAPKFGAHAWVETGGLPLLPTEEEDNYSRLVAV